MTRKGKSKIEQRTTFAIFNLLHNSFKQTARSSAYIKTFSSYYLFFYQMNCLTWLTGWRTGLSPCRCPAWCRHCYHMTLPGRCSWADRRWGRRGCGSRLLTGWHLSPRLLPGDRTREHLRERTTKKRSWEQPKVSQLNATRRLCHTQLVIYKTPSEQNQMAGLDPKACNDVGSPLFC